MRAFCKRLTLHTPWLSIIIPALNEEERLGKTLENIEGVFAGEGIEIVVVDGGSRDQTIKIAGEFPGVKVLSSQPGRGPQMNRGAESASGQVLLFLHADTLLPPGAGRRIQAALSSPEAVGGCFTVETVTPPGRSLLFGLLLKTADWRSRFTRHPYGDQAIFVRTEIFKRLGGFKDYPIMEDLDFSRRLSRAGRIVRVDAPVKVSARRWERNIIRNFLKLKTLPLLFRMGVHPKKLAHFYREAR